jgi:hypothetical protein
MSLTVQSTTVTYQGGAYSYFSTTPPHLPCSDPDPPAPRVAAGMALLDQATPGWESRVNLLTLDLLSGRACILGQLYGTFGAGVAALGLIYDPLVAVGHGFVVSGYRDGVQAAWREAILARRAAQAVKRMAVEAAPTRELQEV